MNNPNLMLSVQTGPQAGQTFQLQSGSQTIGRTSGNQIVVADPTISKQHAQITVQAEGVWIQDLGSSNGTFVNGRRVVDPIWLQPGDTVQVGTTVTLGVQGIGGAVVPAGARPPVAKPNSLPLVSVGLIAVLALLIISGLGVAIWFVWQSAQPADQVDSATPATVEVIATETPTPEEPTFTPVPEIVMDFSVEKTSVQLGECTTLHWSVQNAQEVRLDGERVPVEGSRKVCPQEASKTYRLTILALDGETREQAIALTVPPTPPLPPGVEIEFTADQTTVSFGECTTLRWSVQNAQAVLLEGEKVASLGTQQVCPQEPANTYQLLVDPLEGEIVEQTTIIDVPATPTPTPTPAPTATSKPQPRNPVIDKFIADQYNLNQGSCTTLRWTVRNAQTVRLDGNQVASQGNQRVCPTASTNTYNLVATGAGGGSVQTSVSLAVIAPTPTAVIIVVTPTPIYVQPPPIPSGPASIKACVEVLGGACYIYRWEIDNVKEVHFDGKGVTGHGHTDMLCGSDYNIGKKGVLIVTHLDGRKERVNFYPPTSDLCD